MTLTTGLSVRARPDLRDLGISLGAGAAFMLAVLGGLLTTNLADFSATNVPRSLLAMLALSAVGSVSCYAIGWRRGLFVWPVALALFFQFHFVINHWLLNPLLLPLTATRPELSALLWLAPLLAGAILLSALLAWLVLLRRVRAPRRLALVMLAVAVGAASVTARPLGVALLELTQTEAYMPFTPPEQIQTLAAASPRDALPDIFVLVPDRYPSNRVLREAFAYDNATFTQALAARGFMVFDDLRANYQSTLLSLGASLGLSHLYERQPVKVSELFSALRYNPVTTRLRRSGYEYHHLAGWHTVTRNNPLAHKVYNGTHWLESNLSELELQLVALTPVAGIYRNLMSRLMQADGYYTYECRRLQRQLRYLRELERGDAPLFVWAHLYIPHQPITMDASGECLARAVGLPSLPTGSGEDMSQDEYAGFMQAGRRYRELFTDYKEYLDNAVLTIFDAQRQRSRAAGRDMLFIVLADEGPYSMLWNWYSKAAEIQARQPQFFREKFGIFGAVYASDEIKRKLCGVRSRVNFWRVILSSMYDLELAPLADNVWYYVHQPYLSGRERLLGELYEITPLLGPQEPEPTGCPADESSRS